MNRTLAGLEHMVSRPPSRTPREPPQARHVCFLSGFIEKDEPLRIKTTLFGNPCFTTIFGVGAILFAGVRSFFCTHIPAASVRCESPRCCSRPPRRSAAARA